MSDQTSNKKRKLEQKTILSDLASAMNDTRSSIALLDALALFKSKNTTVHHIASAIGFDPTISEQLLREVNSPHFALPNRVGSLSHAISLLGFQRTQDVIAASSKNDMYKNVENSYFELLAFKRHCIAVGCFSEQIAKFLKFSNLKDFFKAGSLHDVGKYFYLTNASAQFEELVKAAKKEGQPLYQVERNALGTDHAELGNIMAHQWDLPEPICAAIRYHHELPPQVEDRLTSRETQMVKVVSYANLLSHGQRDSQGSTGYRVSIKDLPPAPGVITDDDLSVIIGLAENQFKEECELAGLSS